MKLFPPSRNIEVVAAYFVGFVIVLLIMLVIAVKLS